MHIYIHVYESNIDFFHYVTSNIMQPLCPYFIIFTYFCNCLSYAVHTLKSYQILIMFKKHKPTYDIVTYQNLV